MDGGDLLGDVKRVYKIGQGRVIDGVCGGFARYVGIDPIWVRIGWALLSLAGGIGIIAYLVGMYFFPRSEAGEVRRQQASQRARSPLIAGIILISVGVLIILRAVGVLSYGFWGAWHVAWVILWPLSLIAGGVFFLLVFWRQGSEGAAKFRRLGWDKMVLGVCSGVGEYFRVDPNVVRFFFVLLIILSRGVGLIVYVLIGVLTPEAKDEAGVV
jgi:phage shock protein C